MRHLTHGAISFLALALACSNAAQPPIPDAGSDAGPTCQSRASCDGGEVCKVEIDGGPLTCGPCSKNGDCLVQELCDSTRRCAFRPGFGDQCTLNGDCTAGQFCVQGLCVPPTQVTACQRNRCPAGERCNIQNQVCEEDLGCGSDADCLASQICNLGTRVCEPRCDPMNPGLVCSQAQQCVDQRCVDCTKDSDCGVGITCDAISGRCVAPNFCYTDATCPAGEFCNLATHTCGGKPPPCHSNDGCAKGLVCEVMSGDCIQPSCQPDQFDPNQTVAQAAPVVAGMQYAGLTLCGPLDEDWFSLPLLSGDQIQVSINTDVVGSGYSFDVKLIDDGGVVIGDGNLALNATAPTTGTYYLQMKDGDSQSLYGFSTLVSHGVICPGDAYDPNQTQAQAAPITDGGVGPIYLCAGQTDWFSVAVPDAGISVTLGCDPTLGPLALAIYLTDGGLVGLQNGGLTQQTVVVPAGTPSPVFAVVTGDGADQNAYTLTLKAGATTGALHGQ